MLEFTHEIGGLELHVEATVIAPPAATPRDEEPEGWEIEIESVWVEKVSVPTVVTGNNVRRIEVVNEAVDYEAMTFKGAGWDDILRDAAKEAATRERDSE